VSKIESLAATDAHDKYICHIIDAFGNEPRAACVGEVLHCLDRFEFEGVTNDPVDEEVIDFYDVGS
jgi:hypothetical protein